MKIVRDWQFQKVKLNNRTLREIMYERASQLVEGIINKNQIKWRDVWKRLL